MSLLRRLDLGRGHGCLHSLHEQYVTFYVVYSFSYVLLMEGMKTTMASPEIEAAKKAHGVLEPIVIFMENR